MESVEQTISYWFWAHSMCGWEVEIRQKERVRMRKKEPACVHDNEKRTWFMRFSNRMECEGAL